MTYRLRPTVVMRSFQCLHQLPVFQEKQLLYQRWLVFCGILQRWSRGHNVRGQGQGLKKNPRPRPRLKKNPRPRIDFARTDPLEVNNSNGRGQGQGPRT